MRSRGRLVVALVLVAGASLIPQRAQGTNTHPMSLSSSTGGTALSPSIQNGQILFTLNYRWSNSDLATMNQDGSHVRPMPVGGRAHDPAWRPDAKGIAFVRQWDVFTMNTKGGSLERLTHHGRNVEPTWSPDGRLVAFTRYGPGGGSSTQSIWLMRANGSHKFRLTEGRSPAWSPDDQTLAFENAGKIFVISRNGTGLQQISNDSNFSENTDPTWSPDGSLVAFIADSPAMWNGALVTVRSDGSNWTELTGLGYSGSSPTWSPNGKIIALQLSGSSEDCALSFDRIGVVPASGGDVRTITDACGHSGEPDWGVLS